jgi:Dos2-interacting transcription regulator of RNA-Pol-II
MIVSYRINSRFVGLVSELLAMGPDFVYGIINAIDGERDPRNLLFLFGFMPGFIEKYPLHHLTEEMFEIFSCYFPIDFHPSPQDPAAITRDLLASHLSSCLCASEAFADDCIDLVLEKIESQLVIAKLDSLELLVSENVHLHHCSVANVLFSCADNVNDSFSVRKNRRTLRKGLDSAQTGVVAR